jgi:hypothetical protein
VDHSNSRLLYGILDNLMKKKDDAMLEKVSGHPHCPPSAEQDCRCPQHAPYQPSSE